MANYIILFIVILPFILIFLAIGFLLLPAKLRTKKLGLDCLIIGGVCGSILALYFVTTPSAEQLDKQKHLLFSSSSKNVKSIVIEPQHERDVPSETDLVNSAIVITDKGDIDRLLWVLRKAKPFGPNHPSAVWWCVLTIEDGQDRVVVEVVDTKSKENGLLLYLNSNRTQGWVLGTYRCDELGPVLERLAGRDKESTQE